MINYNSKIHSETNNNKNYIKQTICKILEIQLIFRKKKHKFETKTKITKPQSKLEREREIMYSGNNINLKAHSETKNMNN